MQLDLKSVNLQYNTLVRWADGTNDVSTKSLMFQVLLFFHKILHKPFQLFFFIFKRSPSARERFYISLQPHFSVSVFCILLQFVGPNLGPNLNQIFLCVSFAFCCNLWDLNFIFPLLLFAAICSILDYSKKFPKTTDLKNKQISFKKQQISKKNSFQKATD